MSRLAIQNRGRSGLPGARLARGDLARAMSFILGEVSCSSGLTEVATAESKACASGLREAGCSMRQEIAPTHVLAERNVRPSERFRDQTICRDRRPRKRHLAAMPSRTGSLKLAIRLFSPYSPALLRSDESARFGHQRPAALPFRAKRTRRHLRTALFRQHFHRGQSRTRFRIPNHTGLHRLKMQRIITRRLLTGNGSVVGGRVESTELSREAERRELSNAQTP